MLRVIYGLNCDLKIYNVNKITKGRYKTGAWITGEKLFNLEMLCAHILPIKCTFPVLYVVL